MNMYVSEAVIPQIVAIRYCTLKKKRTHVPPFRYLGCVLQCAVFPHTPVHHTLRSLFKFALFSFFLRQSTTKLPLKHGPKTTHFLALLSINSESKSPSGGASGGPPLPAGGGVATKPRPVSHWSGPVYWHMTQPVDTVYTVLARATRAQP